MVGASARADAGDYVIGLRLLELVETLAAGDRTAFSDLGERTLKGKHETVRVFGFNGEGGSGNVRP